jgi:AbrB family looped-hinge helix DNA binding protein
MFMSLVRIKDKYQVTLPASVRTRAGVRVGDLLEASVQGKRITLTPKTMIDREVARGLEDLRAGRVYGPFASADAVIRSLRGRARRKKAKAS